jgi:DNA helicase HerA-like ATPase
VPKREPTLNLSSASRQVGIVLGTQDATPLQFWVGVDEASAVQLDDAIVVETALPNGEIVQFYGVVDQVRKRYEGVRFDNDAFRAAEGTLPVEISYAAHVQVTRIEPEWFVPPHPGEAAYVVGGDDFLRALSFDRMGKENHLPIGLTRSGEPIYANMEFLDGRRGAHASISGVSGVATKTSYATFVLYSLFHSKVLGADAVNTKALIFNVKGEDLLYLDRPNRDLTPDDRLMYQKLGLPHGPFQSVGLYAPARKGAGIPFPDTGSRQDGVLPYVWTLREFAQNRLLRFMFIESEDSRQQLSFVISRVEQALEDAAENTDRSSPGLSLEGTALRSFRDLVSVLDGPALDNIVPMVASGTRDAFRRRLHAAAEDAGHLIRGDEDGARCTINWRDHQVTVVDIHRLRSRAQMFVVGVLLKRLMEEKEARGERKPLMFLVLDELNKYAPRTGWSPISEVLLDIAERGRSLGLSLFGAQQTASEVERRVIANSALRVVGRLDPAEAERAEYGFLGTVGRQRATLIQPGTMIVTQPEIPTPLLLNFPFPAWATNEREGRLDVPVKDPFAAYEENEP